MIDERLAGILEPLRADYEGRAIPAVFVPGAVSSERASRIRDAVLAAPLDRLDLAHRGRYAHTDAVRHLELEAQLAELASHFTRSDVDIVSRLWTVMRHRDYALRRDDDLFAERARRPDESAGSIGAPASRTAEPAGPTGELAGRTVELVLDVSSRASGEADLVYARDDGTIVFAAPQEPGGLAIVARVAGVRRYERYLTHRVDDLAVVRLRILLHLRP